MQHHTVTPTAWEGMDMDPFATLAAWISTDDDDTRQELADAYNSWRSHGGFPATLDGLTVERMHRHFLTIARVDPLTYAAR